MIGPDWTRGQVETCLNNAFYVEHKDTVCLDMEHASYRNVELVIGWIREMGYHAEEIPENESVKAWRDKPSSTAGHTILRTVTFGKGGTKASISVGRTKDGNVLLKSYKHVVTFPPDAARQIADAIVSACEQSR